MTLPLVGILIDAADLSGQPLTQGVAVLSASVPLTDTGGGAEIFTPACAAAGQVAFIVPTDTPGVQPQGWTCQAEFRNTPDPPQPFSFFAPAGACPFTVAAGSPAVFTWSPASAYSSAGLVPLPSGTGIVLSGGLPAAFSAGVTYWVVNTSAYTFQIAAAPGGTPLAAGTSGSGQVAVTQYRLSALVPVSPAPPPSAAVALLGADLSGQPAQVLKIQGMAIQPPQDTGVKYLRDDGQWATPPGGGGSGGDNFTQEFTNESTVTVTHNLGKYPSVTVIDTAGDEVEGDPDYLGPNSLTMTFSAPFSGTVSCN